MAHAHIPDHPAVTQTVLATLAHLGCATLPQLHALCFPEAFAATVRLALMGLMEAGLITHSHWRLNSGDRSQVWTITTKGLAQLRQEVPTAPQRPAPDLNRPSTPRETDEWRVRIEVRTLLVQLILEARQQPVCASASLSASLLYPTPLLVDQPPQPDATLAIVWEPATPQVTTWLPWLSTPSHATEVTHYAVYVERQGQRQAWQRWLRQCPQEAPSSIIPLLILTAPERFGDVTSQIREHGSSRPIRLCARGELEEGLLHAPWRDVQGHLCSLHPESIKGEVQPTTP